MAITPTISSPGFRVITAGLGQQYSTATALVNYMNSVDFSVEQGIVCVEIYSDLVLTGFQIQPRNVTDNFYFIMRPVPGAGVNELDTNRTGLYGLGGVTLTWDSSNVGFVNNGVRITGFNMHLTGTNPSARAAFLMTKYGQTGGNSKVQELVRNRILVETACALAIEPGNTYGFCNFLDNIVHFGVNSPSKVISSSAFGYPTQCLRNTFVRHGVAGKALGMFLAGNIQDNAFVNMQGPSMDTTYAKLSANYSDSASDSTLAGFTVNTTPGALITDPNSDLKPTAGGALIGVGDSLSTSVNDIFGDNHGVSPDVGAIQRVPAPKLPTATVVGGVVPVGQSLTVNFNTTQSPGSAMASIVPSMTNPAGAVSQQVAPTLNTGAATGAVSFASIAPGNYDLIITVSNAGGTALATGTVSFTVIGISGNPMAQVGTSQTMVVPLFGLPCTQTNQSQISRITSPLLPGSLGITGIDPLPGS